MIRGQRVDPRSSTCAELSRRKAHRQRRQEGRCESADRQCREQSRSRCRRSDRQGSQRRQEPGDEVASMRAPAAMPAASRSFFSQITIVVEEKPRRSAGDQQGRNQGCCPQGQDRQEDCRAKLPAKKPAAKKAKKETALIRVRRSIRPGCASASSRTWDSRWYAGKRELRQAAGRKTSRSANISATKLKSRGLFQPHHHRTSCTRTCRVTIHSARPGVVIGKKGADIEKLKSWTVQKYTWATPVAS